MHSAGARPHATSGIAAWTEDAFARLTGLPSVHRVGLALVEGGGRRLRFTASDRDRGSHVDWCDVDAYDDVPLNAAVRTGEPVIGTLEDLHERYPGYVARQRETATSALAAVPIVAAGQPLGGYLLLYDRDQELDGRQRRQLARIGRDLGAALWRARRAERARREVTEPVPAPAGARVASHDVEGDPAAVADARRFLRRTLAEWGVDDDPTDNATLCLSELVTNAVIHSHDGCLVRVVLADGLLTTSVRNWGGAAPDAVAAVADPLQVHGRGLQVVDALAARWGREADGTSVWFALEVG